MKNQEVAGIFEEIADLLEIKGENPFRIRAYRKAALNIESLTEDVEKLAEEEKLTQVPGIGADLAGKISEITRTGTCRAFEELKRQVPKGVLDLMTIPGVGPKTAKALFENLKIKSIEDLEKKAKAHKVAGLPGMKEKTEENILKGIEFIKKHKERTPLGRALPLAMEIVDELKDIPGVEKINYAGSVRRMKETVKDIDILITSKKPEKIMDVFTKMPHVVEVVAKGETKSSVITKEGLSVDLRVVDPASYGAALCYFTGSKAHNVRIRGIANRLGLKISEYGVFVEKNDKMVAGKEEADIYKAIGLSYIEPELREDQGEIEAAQQGKLPKLVGLEDIKGDFHVHSDWSDGGNTIEEIAQAAKKIGYEYVCITDHSQTLGVAGGLSEKDLMRKVEAVRKADKKIKGIRILCGTEMEILKDGKLDYPDSVLKELDVVIAAVHSGFKMPQDQMTKRILKAIDNKYVNVIAHPTGRLMGVRDAYEVDLDRIFKAAKDSGTFMEINAFPSRLDLNDINARRASQIGAPLLISSDTHFTDQLDNMRYGVAVARRAWLQKKDILNTYLLSEVLQKLKKKT